MASDRLRVVEVLEATVGGTKKHVMDLCLNLDSARFEVHALLSPLRDPDPEATRRALEQAGVRVVHVPLRRGLSPISDLQCLRFIETYLRRVQPQIVHTHSAKAGFLGRLAARRAGIKGVIYTPHGFPFCMNVASPIRLVYLWIERWLGRQTSCIVGVCDSERRLAVRSRVVPPERGTTIENGIEFQPLPEVDREQKLASLGLPADARVILCVGDLRTQKGYPLAIAAMKAVLEAEPGAHLLIAGEGNMAKLLKTWIQAFAEGHVHLLGHRDDVPQLLACCDVFCLPSLWEGCPYALIEAAAAGCAIVGHDIPGINDIVHDGVTGWLAPTTVPRGLEAALLEALGWPDECRLRGLAASQLVRQKHSLARMIAMTAELYEEVAAEGR